MCVCVCVYVSVCVCVCLSHLRYPEQEVVQELCLVSCTNCFSSLHNARFKRKGFERFSPVTYRNPCMHHYTSGYFGQYESCPLHESRWNILKGYALRTCPPHHGYHSCLCLLIEWSIDSPQYEKMITS